MAKQIKIIKHDTAQEWRDKIRITRNNEHKLKMLVIYKILTNPEVSGKCLQETYLISPATMFSWIAQYNENGLEGLKKGGGEKGSGKGNKQADDEVYIALGKEIDNNQEQVWTLEKMQHFIKDKFDIEPTIPAIHYRIKDTHSYKSSRPYPSKANRNELEQFKKKCNNKKDRGD